MLVLAKDHPELGFTPDQQELINGSSECATIYAYLEDGKARALVCQDARFDTTDVCDGYAPLEGLVDDLIKQRQQSEFKDRVLEPLWIEHRREEAYNLLKREFCLPCGLDPDALLEAPGSSRRNTRCPMTTVCRQMKSYAAIAIIQTDHSFLHRMATADERRSELISELKVLTVILPRPGGAQPEALSSQEVYVALVPHNNNRFEPDWQPKYGWTRTRAHLRIRPDCVDDFGTESFQLVIDPLVYAAASRDDTGIRWGLRMRLTPDGPDLIKMEVRLHVMDELLMKYWNDDEANYEYYESPDQDIRVFMHVLYSLALPVSPDHLDDEQLDKSLELHGAVEALWKRQNRAARIIQRTWRHAVSCPDHPVCQRRLMREFNELA